ncbi:MAG: thioesterase superfamily protein [Enterobacter kobei]|nr:thioesterase superfamily protein [Enterobacter kobei]
MTTTNEAPQGELVLRTLAMPADTNANGDIFGGWLMSQMDMGGAIMAKEIAHGRVVTVRVDGMTFLRPVAVGDVVCCYARCVKRGNTSVTINVEVWGPESQPLKKPPDGGFFLARRQVSPWTCRRSGGTQY